MCAVAVTSYVMAYAGPARPALTILYLAALILSAIRFNLCTYTALAVFTLVCYAAVIVAIDLDGAHFNQRAEWLQWLFMALALPWIGWLGTYLERLRRRTRASEAVYRVIWNTSVDAMVIFDDTGAIRLVNPAAARLFDSTPAHMTGKPLTDFAPERLRARMMQYLAAYLAGHKPASDWSLTEGIFLTASGREVPVEAVIVELGRADYAGTLFDDGRRRLALFTRDISQRHALEKIKDDFIATVSHELRTPLTAIAGAVEALQEDKAVQLPPHASSLLNMAASGSERLQRLIDTILNLQKMDTGGIDFSPEPVDAAELIAAALSATREPAAIQGKYLMTTRLEGRAIVRADRRWIHEVLLNLIDNALKFSPAGASVRFTVLDQGPGVPPELDGRIFTRFARAGNSTTRPQGGARLGLSLCKAAIEGCGGTIGHANHPVKGATFWFDLPLAQ